MTSTPRSPRCGFFAAAVASILCAAPAVLSAQPATAQPPAGGAMGQPPTGGPGMGGRGGRMMDMLFEGITLTDVQRTKLDSLQAANRARMMERRGQMQPQGDARPDSAARAQRRQEMMREQESQRTTIRTMLTPDQQKTFDANVARMREQMQQRMRDGGPGGPGRR